MMVHGGVGGAVAGAAAARQRRQILKSFRVRGATARERAVPESSLEIHSGAVFHALLKRRIVVRLPDGRLYLDESAEARAHETQVRIVVAGLIIALLVIAWAVALRR